MLTTFWPSTQCRRRLRTDKQGGDVRAVAVIRSTMPNSPVSTRDRGLDRLSMLRQYQQRGQHWREYQDIVAITDGSPDNQRTCRCRHHATEPDRWAQRGSQRGLQIEYKHFAVRPVCIQLAANPLIALA